MSFEPSQGKTSKIGKGPIVIAAVGVLALAGAGGIIWTQKDVHQQSTEISAIETYGVEGIAPAAGKADKKEKAAETPTETTAETPTEAAPEAAAAEPVTAVGNVKIGDPVVAKIGEEDVKRSEVFAFIATLPEQVRQQMPLETLFPLALDQVLNNRIIGEKADAAKLDADPEVSKMVDQAKDNIVRNVYVERELTKAVAEKDLLKAYETFLKGFQRVEEVHARHILVKDEAAAKDIIAKLEGGTSFEELAKQSTDGATAVNGGDLGFFTKADMIPEFSEVAFKLEPGTYTKEPVKTQFGYHVIKVEEKRQRPEPKFEDVKPQLEAQLRRDKLNAMLEGWQKDAAIKKFDINGDPIATPAPAKTEPKKE